MGGAYENENEYIKAILQAGAAHLVVQTIRNLAEATGNHTCWDDCDDNSKWINEYADKIEKNGTNGREEK